MIQEPSIYELWHQMYGYWEEKLLQSPALPGSIVEKIRYFQVQYLLKIANFSPDDAHTFHLPISVWSSQIQGDYHRAHRQHPLFKALLLKLGKEEFDCFLVHHPKLCIEHIERSCQLHPSINAAFRGFFFFEEEGQPICCIPKENQGFDLAWSYITEKGFTLPMQQAAKLAAKLSLPLPPCPLLDPVKTYFPEPISLSFFLSSSCFKAWEKANCFSGKCLTLLFQALADLNIERQFENLGLLSWLNDSSARALFFMKQSFDLLPSHFLQSQYFLELAHEELLLWLLLIEPYSPSQLQQAIYQNIAPPAYLRTTSSGMMAFSEILQGLSSLSHFFLSFDGCYYENESSWLRSFESDKCILLRFPDYEAQLEQVLLCFQKEKKKIDVLFVNFHENILAGRYFCPRKKVDSILRKILLSSCVDKALTVVIDVTIGYLNSSEFQELLQFCTPWLKKKKLHLLILWSHQKFDLLGYDKVSAGSFCIYSEDPSFIKRFSSLPEETLSSLDQQALTHYFFAANYRLDERREQIFKNACYVNERIDPALTYRPDRKDQPILAVLKEDPINFSLDVRCPVEYNSAIIEAFLQRSISIPVRGGFGFNYTTVCFNRFGLLRFSIGLEEKEFFDRFMIAFNEIFLSYLPQTEDCHVFI